MTHKVTNKLNQKVKYKDVIFLPNETKDLDEIPSSDKFHIEKAEQKEKPKLTKKEE